ncbi:receptor-interacting serine/threonine-protein kinase 2 [Megalops cyprinoides]|uniref:receptor-interacting serine/threonine-protein kinase 2 n=1 Tax=Megalops cyprinoides TaxID=118141 RepID=UPI0018653CE1|nr:receptor-interacting serine/threonine-protein kinase 2 [Megalops cyprinoides]
MAQPGPLLTIPEQDVRDVVLTRTSAGACLRGCHRRTGRFVTLKLLPLRSASESQWSERALGDLELVRRACSERVLAPLGLYRARWLVGTVSEWMPGGSLHSLLYEMQVYPEFPMPLRLRILLDVAEGLSHLHSIPVSHQALKSTNVLLDHQYRAKVCDLGPWSGRSTASTCYEGTGPCIRDLAYLSPEQLRGETPSTEADMYSFGILLWETLKRRAPYENISRPQELLLSVHSGVRPGVEGEAPPPGVPHGHALTQLVARCWSSDPQKRPTAVDCMLELRKALATFHPEAAARAALQLKESKERALQGCKAQQAEEMKLEINNLELYGGCKDTKSTGTKTVPMDRVQASTPSPPPHSPSNTPPKSPSPPPQGRTTPSQGRTTPPQGRTTPQTTSCRGCGSPPLSQPSRSHSFPTPQQRINTGRAYQQHSPSPPPVYCSTPCGTLDPPKKSPPCQPSLRCQSLPMGLLDGQSCCRILRERREVIVRGMTEGRLNYVLDVLRARQALSREAYELITAALTLAARTRSLLDTCLCLGEGAATLVASSLGLVSVVTTRSPCHLYN